MNKFYKKLISTLISALITILASSFYPLKVDAATMTTEEYNKRVAEFQSFYPDGKNCLNETFTYNGATLGWTCHGYARKATGYIFGVECKNGTASGWVRYNATSTNSQINNLSIGDLVRFRSYSGSAFDHTIFITNISGDTITYTECNGDGKGTVKWNRTTTKGNLSTKLVLPLHDDPGYGWITHYTGSPFGKEDTQPSPNVIYPGMAGFTTGGAYWWNGTGYGISGSMKYTYSNGNTRDSWGKWSFNLSSIGGSGYYKVEAYIPNNHATTKNAHYHILHAGKTDYKSVNQNNVSNTWVDLGTYDFTSDSIAVVELDDATGEPFVNYQSTPKVGFDAIRLTYASAIDSESPSGSWITPISGMNIVTPGSINLSVNAADNKSVAKVVFHANYDGQWHELGTDSHGGNGVYNLTWNYDVIPQDVEIHAHLYDTSNNWTNIAGPIVSFSKPAEVTITATDPSASEPGIDKGIFTISRQGGDTSNSLTVTYTVTGTATEESDYSSLNGSIVIPDGTASAAISVNPMDDKLIEDDETVIVTLNSSSAYSVGVQGNASVIIADNDKPTVTFNSQGGSKVTSATADYDSTVAAPTAPTKTGYIFGGWYKETACKNAWDFAKDKVIANTTLYANWTIINVTSVSLNKTTDSLTVGDTDTLIAAVNPDSASNKKVNWSSSNTSVVTLDSTGKIKAVGAGNAVITVTTVDGNKTASCSVTVNAAQVTEKTKYTLSVLMDDEDTFNDILGQFTLDELKVVTPKAYILAIKMIQNDTLKVSQFEVDANEDVSRVKVIIGTEVHSLTYQGDGVYKSAIYNLVNGSEVVINAYDKNGELLDNNVQRLRTMEYTANIPEGTEYTLEKLIIDLDVFNQILSLYTLDQINLVVPLSYLENIQIKYSSTLTAVTVYVENGANKVEFETTINGQKKVVTMKNLGNRKFEGSLAGVQLGAEMKISVYKDEKLVDNAIRKVIKD
jgi:uncharacterized repeat protein (TIGR02543 family)